MRVVSYGDFRSLPIGYAHLGDFQAMTSDVTARHSEPGNNSLILLAFRTCFSSFFIIMKMAAPITVKSLAGKLKVTMAPLIELTPDA